MAVPAPPPRPTIYDVADRAGVSKSLVSLVLRNSPQVSESRRAAVLSAIAELGYRPSRAATDLASRRTKSIEVVIDDYRNLSFVGLVQGMARELAPHGYHLTVTDRQLTADFTPDGLSHPFPEVDGLVVACEPGAADLRGWTGPTVVAGWRESVPDGADLVSTDDESGGRMAADHLIRLGHRKIGHLTGTGGPALHRREGFRDRIAEERLDLLVAGDGRGTAEEDGYHAARELLDRTPDITAVFAANDTMALGALAAIRELGLAVPQGMSLIGFDNSPLAQSRYLDLTSIDDSSEEVGVAVARALVARIGDPELPPSRTRIAPALVDRGTTGGPR